MNEIEKKALRKMNEALNRFAETVLAVDGVDPLENYRHHNQALAETIQEIRPQVVVLTFLKHDDGTSARFEKRVGKNLYRYFNHPKKKGWSFGWTPWADTKGWYWAFTIKPDGKVIQPVKFRKRQTAKARAVSRWEKARF